MYKSEAKQPQTRNVVMPDSLASKREDKFVCACDETMRAACDESFYGVHEGKSYCVLHYPRKNKSLDFETAVRRKLENQDFNFRGVWFPNEVSFINFNFTESADFMYATFCTGADFRGSRFMAHANFCFARFWAEADFRGAIFSAEVEFIFSTFSARADFQNATFSAKAEFGFAKLSLADFKNATFNALVVFSYAVFSADVDFRFAIFSAHADLLEATFLDHVKFAGNESNQPFNSNSSLNLQFAEIEKPDRVSFHTLTLHPHWFLNVDARQFDFTNIHWNNYGKARQELELLKEVPSRYRLLAITCRKLAANAEENDRYRSASQFRRMAMDSERLEHWRGFDFRKLNWWYWLASGYGERITRAALVLLGIWIVAGLVYTHVGFVRWEPKLTTEADAVVAEKDVVGVPLTFSRALTYSAGVMTLQKPEPRPATSAAQTVVLMETILGPVQAALLALAIRRKFMR